MPTQEEIRQLLNKRKKINRENDPPTPLEAALLRQKNELHEATLQKNLNQTTPVRDQSIAPTSAPTSIATSAPSSAQAIVQFASASEFETQNPAISPQHIAKLPLSSPVSNSTLKPALSPEILQTDKEVVDNFALNEPNSPAVTIEKNIHHHEGLSKKIEPEGDKSLRQKTSFDATNSETIAKQSRNKKSDKIDGFKAAKRQYSETIAKQNIAEVGSASKLLISDTVQSDNDLRNNPETRTDTIREAQAFNCETIAKQDAPQNQSSKPSALENEQSNASIAKQLRNEVTTSILNYPTQLRNNPETDNSLHASLPLEKNKKVIALEPSDCETIAKQKSDENITELLDRNSQLRNNPETTHSQLRNNSETKTAHSETSSVQLRSTKRNNPETITKQKSLLQSELLTPRERVLSLSSLQQRLLLVIFESCSATGSRESEFVKNDDVARVVKASADTVRVSFNRIIAAGLLQRLSSKSGRNGWSKYHIAPDVFVALKSLGLTQSHFTLRNNSEAQSETQTETKLSSKLVSNINTNLLNERGGEPVPDFLGCDISTLGDFQIYKKHLMDLHNQKQFFTVEQMDDFIWKFKEYISDSEKVRGVRSFPALFITMARQLASGYDPLESIQTPEQKLLGDLIERNKKALMELKRQKEESKVLEFEIWFEKLNRQERDELAPPNSIVESGSELQKRSLMGYFDKAIWNG